MGIDVNEKVFEDEVVTDEAWNDDNFDRNKGRTPPEKNRNAWRSIEEYRERKLLREQIGDLFDDEKANMVHK